MQVKKFEARTMKEALELVKSQLGPDAIILSVRDNNKSYGLVGEGSVEITAAVSEVTLHKKKFTESRLKETDKEKFSRTPAKQQKEIIERMVQKHLEKNQPPAGNRRYIEIEDDQEVALQNRVAEERVRNAALKAKHSLAAYEPIPPNTPRKVQEPNRTAPRKEEEFEIKALKSEIASLKEVISQFQKIPQNFAPSHPGANYGLPYELAYLFEKLTAVGVAEDLVADLLEKSTHAIPIAKLKNKSVVDGWVARSILESITLSPLNFTDKIHCFVGPSGSGKTSALVKMASHLAIREGKKVALLTTDLFKVGAADQLKIYAQILNVPFAVVRSPSDWAQIAKHLAKVDHVLVDFPGLSLKNSEEIQMIRGGLPTGDLVAKIHLVLPATIKDQDAIDIGRRYSSFNYTDVIFTGLDESSQHGIIYNFNKRFDVPLFAFGIGPRIPEDFEFATKERVLDLLFKITQNQTQSHEGQMV